MSLTTFLARPEVKSRLKLEYETPKIQCPNNMQIEPRTNHYMLTGTAFDYLIRFWIETLNPNAETHEWIAETAVKSLWRVPVFSVKEENKVKQTLKEAKAFHSDYLITRKMTDDIISAAINLARLDAICRQSPGYLDPDIGTIEKPMVDELRAMLGLANPKDFTATSYCGLNPSFGQASRLVGGADADLIIDDTLIEIKTTKKGEMDRSYFNQLIGYFILNELGGVNGKKREINRLGIYFSRYGQLITFPTETIVGEEFPQLVEWFRETAGRKEARPQSNKSLEPISFDCGSDTDGKPSAFTFSNGLVCSPSELLGYLFSRRYRSKQFVFANFGNDEESILYNILPATNLKELGLRGKTEWNGYRFRFKHKKELVIAKGHRSMSIVEGLALETNVMVGTGAAGIADELTKSALPLSTTFVCANALPLIVTAVKRSKMYHIKIDIGKETVIIEEANRSIVRGVVALSVAHPSDIQVSVTKTTEPKEKPVSFAGLTTAASAPVPAKPVAKRK